MNVLTPEGSTRRPNPFRSASHTSYRQEAGAADSTALLVILVGGLRLGTGGHLGASVTTRCLPKKQAGGNARTPRMIISLTLQKNGPVPGNMVETCKYPRLLNGIQEVGGSIPPGSTKQFLQTAVFQFGVEIRDTSKG